MTRLPVFCFCRSGKRYEIERLDPLHYVFAVVSDGLSTRMTIEEAEYALDVIDCESNLDGEELKIFNMANVFLSQARKCRTSAFRPS